MEVRIIFASLKSLNLGAWSAGADELVGNGLTFTGRPQVSALLFAIK